MINQLMSSLPWEYLQASDKKHKYKAVVFDKNFRKLLKKVHYLLQLPNLGYRPMLHSTTVEVCVDACVDKEARGASGISDVDGKYQNTIKHQGKFFEKFNLTKDAPIYLLECWAICNAVRSCPTNTNLRIWSDNSTVIYGIPKAYGEDDRYNSMIRWIHN